MELTCYNQNMDELDIVILPFGEALRYLRRQKRLTQEDIAPLIGISQGTLSNWEKSIYPPKDEVALEQLATILDTSFADLVAGRVHLLGDTSANGVSLEDWERQLRFLKEVTEVTPPEQLPMIAEFAREMALIAPNHQEDVWRLVRVTVRGLRELIFKARILGGPPGVITTFRLDELSSEQDERMKG